MEPYLYWIATGVAFLVSAFCSIAEGSLLSFSFLRLEQKDVEERKRVEPYLPQIDRYLFTAIVLNAISDVVLVWVCTIGFRSYGEWYALGVSLLIVILGAEVLPRAVAARNAEWLLPRVLPPIAVVDRMLLPVTWPLRKVGETIQHALAHGEGGQRRRADEIVDEIRSASLEGSREGVLNKEDVEMIESIIEFHDVEVREIMTPRAEVVSIDVSAPIAEAVKAAVERGHSRIPIHEGSRDHIVGVVYAKDLLRHLGSRATYAGVTPATSPGAGDVSTKDVSIRSLMRKPIYVPGSKPVGDLLKEFREKRVHIAIVLDEYGGAAGVVTIEDVIEAIVGEIDDEYDEGKSEPAQVRKIDATTSDVDARLKISEANEKLGLSLPEAGEFETLGGFIFFKLGKIPKKGEKVSHDGAEFTVLEADERRIRRLRVQRVPSAEKA